MTITRAIGLAALLAHLACNPLDPSKIAVEPDSGSAASCSPACTAGQHCLRDQAGTCGCYAACDNSLCQAGSCVQDPAQGAVCVDLAQTRCQ